MSQAPKSSSQAPILIGGFMVLLQWIKTMQNSSWNMRVYSMAVSNMMVEHAVTHSMLLVYLRLHVHVRDFFVITLKSEDSILE